MSAFTDAPYGACPGCGAPLKATRDGDRLYCDVDQHSQTVCPLADGDFSFEEIDTMDGMTADEITAYRQALDAEAENEAERQGVARFEWAMNADNAPSDANYRADMVDAGRGHLLS